MVAVSSVQSHEIRTSSQGSIFLLVARLRFTSVQVSGTQKYESTLLLAWVQMLYVFFAPTLAPDIKICEVHIYFSFQNMTV